MNTTERYNKFSILLHWLMVLLFIATYAFIEFRVLFEKGTDARDTMKLLHFSFGLSVFLLVWLRLLLRCIYRAPSISPTPPAWQLWLARAAHLALYGLMIGLPLAGWLMLSAFDKTIPFFAWQLPSIIEPAPALGKEIKHWHELIGQVGYGLIGFHALAGLFHHYIVKDNTLLRILPRCKK